MKTNNCNYIGKNEPRVDAYDKVTGKGYYTDDFAKRIPDLIHVKSLRSPYGHAKIKKLDIRKAESIKGVVKIFTEDNNPGFHIERLPDVSKFSMNNELIWNGQLIALVAAETPEIAQAAVEAIEIEYEVLPAITDVHETLKLNPISVIDPNHDTGTADASNIFSKVGVHVQENSKFVNASPNIVGNYYMNKGDVDEAIKKCDVVLERSFATGRKTTTSLELPSCMVEYNSDDSITVYTGGAGVHGVIKAAIRNIFELPENKIRVIQPYMGGSFGGRLTPYVEMITVLMSLYTKRSVKYEFSRKEAFLGAPANWPCATRVKFGATRDGRILVQDYDLVEDIGAIRGNVGFTGRLSSSGAVCVYDIDNIRMDTCATVTNTVPAAPYRGLGCPESEFGIECMMNELADELGMSPVDIRVKNFIKKNGKNGYGEKVTSIGVEGCLRAVADAVKVDEPCEQDGTKWKIGRGIAAAGKQNTPLGRSEAIVRYNSDGSVELLISCDENGMGAMTVIRQIAATTLKLPIEKIKVIKGDTQVTPYDNYSASSRTTYTCGNATKIACEEVRDQLQEHAAREIGVHKSKCRIEGNKAYFVGTDIESIDISSLFKPMSPFSQGNWGLKQGSPVIGHGVYCPAPIKNWGADGLTARMWNWYQFAACGVEVAVNEETGQVKLLKVANAADTGNPINPKTCEGQIEGGTSMAWGFVMNEEHLYDKNGTMTNAGISDYRIPTVLEQPKNENVLPFICPDPLPDGPYGAKGMSESITIPVAPAIAEAIYKAVGVRPTFYPMTAERILALIKEKKAKEASK